jgi:hypothetical protein
MSTQKPWFAGFRLYRFVDEYKIRAAVAELEGLPPSPPSNVQADTEDFLPKVFDRLDCIFHGGRIAGAI